MDNDKRSASRLLGRAVGGTVKRLRKKTMLLALLVATYCGGAAGVTYNSIGIAVLAFLAVAAVFAALLMTLVGLRVLIEQWHANTFGAQQPPSGTPPPVVDNPSLRPYYSDGAPYNPARGLNPNAPR